MFLQTAAALSNEGVGDEVAPRPARQQPTLASLLANLNEGLEIDAARVP